MGVKGTAALAALAIVLLAICGGVLVNRAHDVEATADRARAATPTVQTEGKNEIEILEEHLKILQASEEIGSEEETAFLEHMAEVVRYGNAAKAWQVLVDARTSHRFQLPLATKRAKRAFRTVAGSFPPLVERQSHWPHFGSEIIHGIAFLRRHGSFEEVYDALGTMASHPTMTKPIIDGEKASFLWARCIADAQGPNSSKNPEWKPTRCRQAQTYTTRKIFSDNGLPLSDVLIFSDADTRARWPSQLLTEPEETLYGVSPQAETVAAKWASEGVPLSLPFPHFRHYLDRPSILLDFGQAETMSGYTIVEGDKVVIFDWQVIGVEGTPLVHGETFSGSYIYLGEYYGNFHHLLMPVLSRIALIVNSGMLDADPDLRLIMDPYEHRPAVVEDFLSILPSYVRERIIVSYGTFENVKYIVWEEVMTPEGTPAPYTMLHHRRPPPHAIRAAKDFAMPAALKEVTADTIIIMSRDGMKERRTTDTQEIVTALRDAVGDRYEVVHFGEVVRSLSEQIELFARAKLIYSPHGAGLSNMLWSKEGTVLVERPTHSAFQSTIFSHTAYSLGHNYFQLRHDAAGLRDNKFGVCHYGHYAPLGAKVAAALLSALEFAEELDL